MSKYKYFIITSLLCVIAIHVGLYFKLKKYDPSQIKDETHQASLFITSPIEETLLENIDELWPKTYNEDHLLEAKKISEFYDKAYQYRQNINLGFEEITTARRWAVLLNTKHYGPLKEDMFGGVRSFKEMTFEESLYIIPGLKKKYDRCDLFMQERVFRLAQVQENLRKDAVKYFEKCTKGESLSGLWLEIFPLLTLHSKKLADFRTKLSSMSMNPNFKYKRTQALNYLKIIDFSVNH